MKRTFSILLLLVFAFNIGGFLSVFEIQKGMARKQMKRRLKEGVPEAQLSHITIGKQEAATLEWKKSNEFRYKGNLYDIVKSSRDADGTIHYYCVTDKQETVLFANLDELVKQSTGTTENSPVKGLYKILLKLYSPPSLELIPSAENNTETFFSYHKHSPTPSFDPASPPPWLG